MSVTKDMTTLKKHNFALKNGRLFYVVLTKEERESQYDAQEREAVDQARFATLMRQAGEEEEDSSQAATRPPASHTEAASLSTPLTPVEVMPFDNALMTLESPPNTLSQIRAGRRLQSPRIQRSGRDMVLRSQQRRSRVPLESAMTGLGRQGSYRRSQGRSSSRGARPRRKWLFFESASRLMCAIIRGIPKCILDAWAASSDASRQGGSNGASSFEVPYRPCKQVVAAHRAKCQGKTKSCSHPGHVTWLKKGEYLRYSIANGLIFIQEVNNITTL